MSEIPKIRVLLGEIGKSRSVLSRIAGFYDRYLAETDNARARTTEQAIVLSEILANYYTCLETMFLRISQFFENQLEPEKWHQDLLHKMSLCIEGIREPVISDETGLLLAELLRLRHFKRYYFEYDWDRIDFLLKKFQMLRPALQIDLDQFTEFLGRLAGDEKE